MKLLLIFIFEFITVSTLGETNLGTINTIENGFATLNECEAKSSNEESCNRSQSMEGLRSILNFTTTNQCIASRSDFKAAGVSIPKCPSPSDTISGLDNTNPTAGTFALYTGDNDSFIANLASSYLSSGSVGRFNLIIPKDNINFIKESTALLEILNSNRVNIIEVDTMPSVERWMQDSFQFTSLSGKPALYQLSHKYEAGTNFEDRLACELARKCDIPYYVPPDLVEPGQEVANNLNGGGNLEVLPGGSFYTGTIQTDGHSLNVPDDAEIPYSTYNQNIRKRSLEASGNTVIELDVSFLNIGHVDEIVNIVKTNKASPCDYAVLMASPSKAFELMETEAQIRESDSVEGDNRCSKDTYEDLYYEGTESVIGHERVSEVYSKSCIDGEPIESYVQSTEYEILKRENLTDTSPVSIAQIMENNKVTLIAELQKSTGCQSPDVIDVPVFFRDGLSYTPDLVNGVVETSGDSASKVLLPRSYFGPFDNYVNDELQKVGVDTTFIHDMGYHLRSGEVHCGTNSARICTP
jgi:hypothetical protein